MKNPSSLPMLKHLTPFLLPSLLLVLPIFCQFPFRVDGWKAKAYPSVAAPTSEAAFFSLAVNNQTVTLAAKAERGLLLEQALYLPPIDKTETTLALAHEEARPEPHLTPLKLDQAKPLPELYFAFNQASLTSQSVPELERILELLNANPALTLAIGGHTDNVGADAYNLKLSASRAETVKNYLIEKGIEAARLLAKGYGETKPQTANITDEGQQRNRRVEFTIVTQ